MAVLSLIAKGALAVAGIGSVIAIPTVLSLNTPSSGEEVFSPTKSDLPEDCYVIKTENNDSQKLLVCVSSDTPGLSSENYYLWKQWENKAKVSEVTKETGNKEIKVKLQETEGSAQKEVIMQVSDKEWDGNTTPVNLSDCSFVSHLNSDSRTNKVELSCPFGWGVDPKKIPLTKFES